MSLISSNYLSTAEWLHDVVKNSDLILCGISALEFLELFNGYVNETKIYVYAKYYGKFDNIEYNIVRSFNDIEYDDYNGVLCTTINQTINDLLADYDNTDELAFIEALSNYYFFNNESFEKLKINPENINLFNDIKTLAITYYNQD